MSKENPSEDNNKEDDLKAKPMPITIHAQYVRDVSFENPNAPQSLRSGGAAPEMDINIGMDARKIKDGDMENLYEVVLSVRAEAKRAEDVLFIAEVPYGVAVPVGEGVPEDSHHPLLLIEIPKLVFPYVRKILSDLTIEGGYPPLLLSPVDFQTLYIVRFAKDGEEKKAADA